MNWTRADLRSHYSGNGEYDATDHIEFLGTDNEFRCPECDGILTDDEQIADGILGLQVGGLRVPQSEFLEWVRHQESLGSAA